MIEDVTKFKNLTYIFENARLSIEAMWILWNIELKKVLP